MSWKQKSFFTVMALLLVVTGCASYKIGMVDTRRIQEYSIQTSIDGITLAANPFDSTQKAQQGFYVDVTKEGFYPVQLIFQNESNDMIIFLRETVELIDTDNNIYRPVRSTLMADTFEHNKIMYALLGFGIFSYMSAEEANSKMQSDWREKELLDQSIVLRGRKKSGFLYFKLPKGKTIKGCHLKVIVEKLSINEEIPLELVL